VENIEFEPLVPAIPPAPILIVYDVPEVTENPVPAR
jgi:hypothetical protein